MTNAPDPSEQDRIRERIRRRAGLSPSEPDAESPIELDPDRPLKLDDTPADAAGERPPIVELVPARRRGPAPSAERAQAGKAQSAAAPPAEPAAWYVRAWPWAAVFVLALGLRVAYVEQIRVVPFVGTPVGDAAAYDTWAREIAAGNWAGDETFYQAPAYPYFLALVYRFIGDGPLGIRWAQAVLGAFSCLLIGLAAARFFALTRTARAEGEGAATGASPRDKVGLAIGLTAAVLLAIYPPAIFFGGLVQKTALATFWMALLLWLASIQLDQPRGWVFLIMGIVLGLFGLTRENALVLAVVFLCWIVLGWRSAGWHARKVWAAHFVFGLLIVFYPVALRNWVVAGEWVVTTVQAGPNFYIGNHEGATGRYEPLRPGNESPPFEREDARQLAEQEAGDEGMTDLEVSRFWLAKSWDFIRHQPLAWLKLLGFKLLLAINHYEITDTEGYNVYCAYAWMLGAVARFLHFGIIGPLAAAGAVLTLSRWRRLGILYAMTLALLLAIAAFYVFARYRFPLVPLAVMFAGAGVIEFVQAARARQLGRSIAAVLAIAAVALAANLRINPEKRLDGIAYANVGAALAERGDIDAAMRFFQQAIEQSPQSPEPYYNIGVAYWLQGNTSLAMENLLQAKRLRPDLARVDFMLGAILEQEGNREDALRYYREALRVNPEDSDAAAAIKRLTSSGAL